MLVAKKAGNIPKLNLKLEIRPNSYYYFMVLRIMDNTTYVYILAHVKSDMSWLGEMGNAVLVDSWISLAALFIASFVASFSSTSFGAGGSLLLVSMATVLPISVVVPMHACVTFVGNLSRWALLHRFVDYTVVLPFIIGTAIGIVLAAPLVGQIPVYAWQFLLGTFLLGAVWWKPRGLNAEGKHYSWQCGVITSFLSVFVGATKPLLVALFGQRFAEHRNVVATSNACSAFPHIGKIILFSAVGGAFYQYWWLIVTLIFANTMGAVAGKHLTISTTGDWLSLIFKIFVTALSVNLLAMGLGISPWS
ncbi:MAG: sulfite exporter TauE/SafE family protein [Geminicoccaceae bacterium]